MELLYNLLPFLGNEFNGNISILQEMIKGTYSISSGGITMKNISRWTGTGGSYRSIQRLMLSPINWLCLNLSLFYVWLSDQSIVLNEENFILAVDEVVEPKSRNKTDGIGFFYSTIFGKQTRSICRQAISIVDVKNRKSFILEEDKQKSIVRKKKGKKTKTKQKPKRKVGRPANSVSKLMTIEWYPIYISLDNMLKSSMLELNKKGNIRYLVADGKYANKNGILVARRNSLELISKAQKRTAFYFPAQQAKKKQGAPKKYGKKLQRLTKKYRVKAYKDERGLLTEIFHYPQMWNKKIGVKLNVVIIIKTKKNGEKARVVLITSCPKLSAEQIIDFYSLRFQIEFNFRDAKQYFGLADFKNTKEISVKNAVNFSFFMTNLSAVLANRAKKEYECEQFGIQDLKALFRGYSYLQLFLNYTDKTEEQILNKEQKERFLGLGSINWMPTKRKKAS